MASYVLKNIKIQPQASGASYSTGTVLFTVPAGHIYLIKKAIIAVNITTAGASSTSWWFESTDPTPANEHAVTPRYTFSSSGAVTNGKAVVDYCAKEAGLTGGVPVKTNGAVTIATGEWFYAGNNSLENAMLEAGAKITMYPVATDASANTSIFAVNCSVIDYTL